jgi:dTDP-4-dehydrorhamnose 3,5-epimerase
VADLFPRLRENAVVLGDARGRIEILFETDQLVLKRSSSAKGVFRGLHRQVAPYLQDKIIRVVSGKILDFVTDPDAPAGVIEYSEITPADDWVHIAAHLAHGFFALEDVVFEYFCIGGYNEAAEESYFVADVVRVALSLENMQLSAKDQAGKPLHREVVAAPRAARQVEKD